MYASKNREDFFWNIRKSSYLITVVWSGKKPHLLSNFCVKNRPPRIPNNRGGVLDDTFWSPWLWPRRLNPWPWSLQVLENALLSAEDIKLLKMIHGHELFSLYLGNWHFLARRPFFSFWRTPAPCVLGLEHSCPWPREVSPWPWSRIFLYHWPKLRTLCPRLHLCPRQIINYSVSEKSATCGVKNESVKLNITIIVWMAGNSRVARISQRWGAFFEVWFNRKRTWPEFLFGFNWIEANSERFSAKIEWSPKKSLHRNSERFSVNWHPLLLLISRSLGGLFLFGGGYFPF